MSKIKLKIVDSETGEIRNAKIQDIRLIRGVLEPINPQNIIIRSANEKDMNGDEIFQGDKVSYGSVQQEVIHCDSGLIMECSGAINKHVSKGIERLGSKYEKEFNMGIV